MSMKKPLFPTYTAAEAFTPPPKNPLADAAAEAFALPPQNPLADAVAKPTNPFPPGEAAKAFDTLLRPAPTSEIAKVFDTLLRPAPTKTAQLMTPPPKRKCYVGMTMNLAQRKREHESDYGEIHKWEWHGPYFPKTAAQAAENQLADDLGCHSHWGGRGDELALWYVYSFEYEE